MTTPRHMLRMPERDRIETEVLMRLGNHMLYRFDNEFVPVPIIPERMMREEDRANLVRQRGARLPSDRPMTADSWWHAGEPQHPGDSPSIGKIANPGRKYYKGLERRPAPVAPRGDVYTEIKKLSLFPNIYNHGR